MKTTDFDLETQKKDALAAWGRACTEKYFAWFENPENHPVNRP